MMDFVQKQAQKWKLTELESVVDEFDSRLCDRINELELKMEYSHKNILVYMSGKSIVTMKEIITLVRFGYPDGALSLARNLYEQYIIAAFFERHKDGTDFQDYVADFFSDYELQRLDLCRYDPLLSAEQKEKLKQEMADIRKNMNPKGRSSYQWAGKNSFYDLTQEIRESQTDSESPKFAAMLHMMYKKSCKTLHASCAGNMGRLGDDDNFVGIDNRPHENEHEIPLLFAVISFLYVAQTVCNEFNMDGEDWKARLNELLSYYIKIL